MLGSLFFKNNRKKLQQSLDEDALIVLTAQSLLQRSGDTTFPFRQDSTFFYFTGIEEPEVVVVLSKSTEFIILPKRSKIEESFGGTINRDEVAKVSGIQEVYGSSEGWEKYKKLQKGRNKVHTLSAAPTKITHLDKYFTNPARKHLLQKLKRLSPHIEVVDIRPQVVALRQVKQPEELNMIKEAIAITARGFEAVQKLQKPGVKEYEIAAEFDYVFRKHNTGHAYLPIIASGGNAAILHYNKNNTTLESGSLLLLDVGAEYQHYAADITRTYPIGPVSERQYALHQAVLRVHKATIGSLKSGDTWRAYFTQAEQYMGEELLALQLISANTREQVRRYFSHGISHNLGLDVHDVCDYKKLQENMVITVEPGIYIPEEGVGVRIEDDILITKEGAVNLSSHIPYW